MDMSLPPLPRWLRYLFLIEVFSILAMIPSSRLVEPSGIVPTADDMKAERVRDAIRFHIREWDRENPGGSSDAPPIR
jgi:hypothetical protein